MCQIPLNFPSQYDSFEDFLNQPLHKPLYIQGHWSLYAFEFGVSSTYPGKSRTGNELSSSSSFSILKDFTKLCHGPVPQGPGTDKAFCMPVLLGFIKMELEALLKYTAHCEESIPSIPCFAEWLNCTLHVASSAQSPPWSERDLKLPLSLRSTFFSLFWIEAAFCFSTVTSHLCIQDLGCSPWERNTAKNWPLLEKHTVDVQRVGVLLFVTF